MSAQDFEGDDEGVGHEVVVDAGVEDLDCAVVGAGGEEGVCGVEGDGTDGAGVVSREDKDIRESVGEWEGMGFWSVLGFNIRFWDEVGWVLG